MSAAPFDPYSQYYSAGQIAQILNVSRNTVKKWLGMGSIKPARMQERSASVIPGAQKFSSPYPVYSWDAVKRCYLAFNFPDEYGFSIGESENLTWAMKRLVLNINRAPTTMLGQNHEAQPIDG